MTIVTQPSPDVEAAADEIFLLLRDNGPLCASQISVERLIPLRNVMEALILLKERHIVEQRPDRDETLNADESLAPWGLATGRKR